MSKKIRTTRSYLRHRFLRVIIATFIFLLLPVFLIVFIQGSTVRINETQTLAENYLADTWQEIDLSSYVENGGSAMIVDSKLNVVYLAGGDISGGVKTFNTSDWTEFLRSTGNDHGYEYGVAYKDGNDGYWLVLRNPISVSFTFYLTLNPEGRDYKRDAVSFMMIILTYWIALITFIIFYSKAVARKFTSSLESISQDAVKLAKGQYDVNEAKGETSELDTLGKTMLHLAGELKEKEKIRSEEEQKRMLLVSELSHDLKTPLASVQGYSELLLKDDVPEDKKRTFLEVINNNSVKADEILKSLLMYSKLGSAGYQPTFEKTDICETVRRILADSYPRFENAGFILSSDIPDTEINVILNSELFRRAVDNLLENALKYNPKGTEVKVSLNITEESETDGNKSEWADLTVGDNGIGIPEEEVDKIFAPFYRAERIFERSGSGLGLAIVKRIVEIHGGNVCYENEKSGGSNFVIRFPVKQK